MATFVEITPDAFNEGFQDAALGIKNSRDGVGRSPGQVHVRRPVRGIQIKDETYATIQVRRANGQNLPLFDGAGMLGGTIDSPNNPGQSYQNSNFLIQSLVEQRAEKQQVVLTFGEPYIFFFGEQPRMIQVSGILLNTEDFNWRAEWWENYDLYLRGTACVRQRARVYLSWDDIIVEGYVTNASAQEDSQNRNLVQFQFQMFLTNYDNVSAIGNPMGHLKHKEMALDPASIDVLGTPGIAISKTSIVRQMNLDQLNQGRGAGSLLDSLRSGDIFGALSAGTERLVEIQGQVIDILSQASRFVSGRNIRVPIGFQGSAAFDDFDVSLASRLPSSLTRANRNVVIQGAFGRRAAAQNYGPLYLNEDEFVARVAPSLLNAADTVDLFAAQLAEDIDMGAKVRDVFLAYGVEVEAPDEARLLAIRGIFGIVSVGLGSALGGLTESNGTARFAANLL